MRLSPVVAVVIAAVLASTAVAQDNTLDASEAVTFYVAKAHNGEPHPDAEFARWASDTSSMGSIGALVFVETDTESDAVTRVHWAGQRSSKYGEMRAIEVDGKRGAEVYIHTATDGLGDAIHNRAQRDRLFRDSIVFLTCVHEIVHAVGLSHTDKAANIMYSFQYGGDIERYFMRYRKGVKKRTQMRERSPLSDNDIARLRALY
jgi:hypothetical protein